MTRECPKRNVLMFDRQHRITLRHTIAAVAGVSLVLSAIYMLYQGSVRMYYDYYLFAQVKEHYIAPPARQRVIDAIALTGISVALYVAHQLLRYSFAIAGRPASDR